MVKRKKVVYLGNKLSRYKSMKSVLDTLEPLFSEFCDIKSSSDKENQFIRFVDMMVTFLRYGLRSDKIIIDVYSTKAFYFAYILAILSRLFNKKYILFLHGGDLPKRYQRNPVLVSSAFKGAHCLIAPSNYLKNYFEIKGFNMTHIPNIIEIENYPFKERKNIKPNILSIRGFGKAYNPLMTLQAINELKDKINSLNLLMLGDKNEYYYSEVIDYIKQNKLDNKVKISGKCTKEEWLSLSKNYDIMVSNPIIDNTPISVIEGMALGLFVISTDVGGIPDLLEDNIDCFLVKSNDYKQLANTIEKVIENLNMFSEIQIKARLKAESFDWKSIKPVWMEIINS